MNSLKKDIQFVKNNMTNISKYIIRYGTVLLTTLAVSAFYFYIKSELSSDPYYDIMMYTDILHSIKECIAAVYILPMIGEILFISAKK